MCLKCAKLTIDLTDFTIRYCLTTQNDREFALCRKVCMELNSLFYFAEAAKDLNFTKTANRLFISQQNLSNHIARLEEYYDVRLFERRPRVELTYAGEVLLTFANNLKLDEENIRNVFADIKQKETGTLHIGASPSRSSIVLPILAERFSEKYPNVELHFHHYHSDVLLKMLLDGKLDFSVSVDKLKHPNLVSKALFYDSLYLMVSRELLQEYLPEHVDHIAAAAQKVSIRDFVTLPFANIQPTHIVDDFFAAAGCSPHFVLTSNYPQFFLPFSYGKAAASIITKTVYLHIRDYAPSNIIFLPLEEPDGFALNALSFTRHKQKYLSQYGRYFLEITEAYFGRLRQDE